MTRAAHRREPNLWFRLLLSLVYEVIIVIKIIIIIIKLLLII